VDAGYRGEILVNLVNLDPERDFAIHRGDRIAQLVVQRVHRAQFVEVDSLDETVRGDTGHGSTGGFGARPPDGTVPVPDPAPDASTRPSNQHDQKKD
jgi:dUTP pyrophosphatase